MTGTNRSHHTRGQRSRSSRYKNRAQKSIFRQVHIDYGLELRAILFFIGFVGAAVATLFGLVKTGVIDSSSDAGLIIAFSLGIIVTCALASSLTFLLTIRHKLLLVTLGSLILAAGAIAFDLTPLEGLAKILLATSAGLWIALMLTSISQVMLIAALIIIVDIYSVFMGPTKKIVESGSHLVDYLTINLPVFGAPAVSQIGISDIIFFALFVATTIIYKLRRSATAIALSLSFVTTMIIGVSMDAGVPALPLLSIFFLTVNADLLYRRFLEEPDEHRNKGDINSNGKD